MKDEVIKVSIIIKKKNRSIDVRLKTEGNVNAIEWLENKTRTELFELEKTSDPQIVADYITGLVTVLNQVCLLFIGKEVTVF